MRYFSFFFKVTFISNQDHDGLFFAIMLAELEPLA